MGVITYTSADAGAGSGTIDNPSIQIFDVDDPYNAATDNRPLIRIHGDIVALDAAFVAEHNDDGTHKSINGAAKIEVGTTVWTLKPFQNSDGNRMILIKIDTDVDNLTALSAITEAANDGIIDISRLPDSTEQPYTF